MAAPGPQPGPARRRARSGGARALAAALPLAPAASHPALARSCRAAAAFVAQRRRDAGRRLCRWLASRRLAPEGHPVWAHSRVTKKTLIRLYMARYPDDFVHSMLHLIPRKLGRPELARVGAHTAGRRRLRHMLGRCARLEIVYAGW